MRRAPAAALGALALGTASLGASGLARADEDPVRLSVRVPAVVAAHVRVPLRVRVDGDVGAFDPHAGSLRLRVRVAARCGGDFEGTAGRVVIDRALRPQPVPGAAYSSVVSARPRFRRYARLLVCAFVTDAEDRQYATSVDAGLLISRPCTRATRRKAGAQRALRRARFALAHTHRAAERTRLRRRIPRLRRALRTAGRARARICRTPG